MTLPLDHPGALMQNRLLPFYQDSCPHICIDKCIHQVFYFLSLCIKEFYRHQSLQDRVLIRRKN